MRDFLSLDNPFMRFLGRIADCMILNFLFVLCCLPVVTIGASITSLYYVALKICDHKDGYIVSRFFKAFKENFKQATIIWMIMLAFGVILGADCYVLHEASGFGITAMRILVIVAILLYMMILTYIFPTLSKFYNTTKDTFKNALLIALGNFSKTIILLLITGGAGALTFFNEYTIWYGIMIWFLMGFALLALAHSYFLRKIYTQYIEVQDM